MKTYNNLLRITPKRNVILKIIIYSFSLILLLLISIKTYDSYKCFGINNNKVITLNVPINNSDIITNGAYLKVNNEKHKYEVTSISNLKVEDYINYKEIKIKVDNDLEDNEVVEITFYSNKEMLMKKIIKLIF